MPAKHSAPAKIDLNKLQPKLRMIRNGDSEVNTLRAEQASPICVAPRLARAEPKRRSDVESQGAPRSERSMRITSLKKVASDVYANVFIQTNDIAASVEDDDRVKLPARVKATGRNGTLTTATVPLSELGRLTKHPAVTFIELGEPLATPQPEISSKKVSAPARSRFGFTPPTTRAGRVLIGIIDVQGFDFAHPDFLAGKHRTRWMRIWDQGGTARKSPAGFDYGAEFDNYANKHLDDALRNASEVGVRPQDLECQAEMVPGSHGTHVASIAAGNSGVCPHALLAGVVVSLTEKDGDPRASFYDSTRLAHAVEYLLGVAEEMKLPISINISLGTNGHAHDGSSAISRWIDSALTVPGRCVCVAAGNAGQEIAETPDDYGYVMGRIHTSGRIASAGLDTDLEWIVVGNGVEDLSENELELWYSAQDRFAISVRPPGMDWIGPIEPRQFIENRQLADKSFLSIYNELYHPANGCNYIAVYLSPLLQKRAIGGVRAGQWTVRLHGREVRNGDFHGWIERDDPRPLGRHGLKEYWNFPSFFSERSNVDNSSVGSLGCGNHIITVANLDLARDRIAKTSSQGPTRDGRNKPDVAAPGTEIVAAKGFSDDEDLWVAMSGTSMASPVVAGLVALMLARERQLTAAQIQGILHRTALPFPGGGYSWANDIGYGRLNADAALAEVTRMGQKEDRTK